MTQQAQSKVSQGRSPPAERTLKCLDDLVITSYCTVEMSQVSHPDSHAKPGSKEAYYQEFEPAEDDAHLLERGNQEDTLSSEEAGAQQQNRSLPYFLGQYNKAYIGVAALLCLILLSLTVLTPSTRDCQRTSAEQACRWVFDHYEASEYETFWKSNIEDFESRGICQVLTEPRHAQASLRLLTRTRELYATPSGHWKDIKSKHGYVSARDDLFSRFIYRRECFAQGGWTRATGVGKQLIEPLWGILRDPFDPWCGSQALHSNSFDSHSSQGQSKAHILPQGYAPFTFSTATETKGNDWRVSGIPPWFQAISPVWGEMGELLLPSNHQTTVLDLGSSYFSSWQSVSAFASGTWFYNTYHQRGLTFNKYVAVELEALQPEEAYRQLPEDLVGVYTLMNVGLTFDGIDELDAVELIRAIADKEHFFVLKLDIDSASLEIPLAHALRDDPTLASLVNEMYFEHHVDSAPLRKAWGYNLQENMADSYELFSKLRSNGIRAHSWP